MRWSPSVLAQSLALVGSLALAGGAPACVAATAAPPVAYTMRLLSNGLKVYAVRDSARPKVSVQVWYGVGSKDDPPGRAGLAHLFEHLMFRSRGPAPAGYLDELTESAGGDDNASTARDFTEFHDTVASSALERVLWAEAARMASLDIGQADLDSERVVVERELKEAVADDGPADPVLTWKATGAGLSVALEPGSPIGAVDELRRIDMADVQAFRARYYRPDNAVLVVAGDFDPAELDGWVDKYFGAVARPAAPAPQSLRPAPEGQPPAPSQGGRARGGRRDLAVVLGFPGPAADDPDAPALAVLDALLTGDDASRGDADLVRPGLASDVFSQADLRRAGGVFYIGAVRERGVSSRSLEAGLRRVVGDLRQGGVGREELDRAKNRLLAQALQARETVEGVGQEIGRTALLNGDASAVNTEVEGVAAVTAADVQRVARRYLRPEQELTVRVDAAGAAARGRGRNAANWFPEPPAGLAAAPGPRVQVEERKLANGLRVAVARSGHVPLATAVLAFPVGAALDRPGEGGLTELAADLALFGCPDGAESMASRFDALGLSATVRVEEQATTLTVTGLSSSLAEGLKLMAGCIQAPPLSPAAFRKLRGDLVGLDPPQSDLDLVADRAFDHLIFGAPSHRAVAARARGLSRMQAQARRAELLRPGRATLVLAGDVEPEAAFALSQRLFGGWTASAPAAVSPALTASSPAASTVLVDAPGYSLALVAVGAPVPAHGDPQRPAFELAASALGGSYTSRMSQALRIRGGLTYDVSSRIAWRSGAGLFSARAEVDPAAAAQAAELMVEQIRRLGTTGPDAHELAKQKALIAAARLDASETTEGLAGLISDQATRGEPLSDLLGEAQGADAVEAAAVRRAAARLAASPELRTVIVADLRRLPPKLRQRLAGAPRLEARQLVELGD